MMYIYGTWLDWLGLYVGVPLALGVAFMLGAVCAWVWTDIRWNREHTRIIINIMESREKAWKRELSQANAALDKWEAERHAKN